MDAFPSIARCLRSQHRGVPAGQIEMIAPWLPGDDRPRAPHVCSGRGVAECFGPNLLLWTGRNHTPVLTIKE